MSDLETLKSDFEAAIQAAADNEALEAVSLDALGKKGRISEQLKQLGGLPEIANRPDRRSTSSKTRLPRLSLCAQRR